MLSSQGSTSSLSTELASWSLTTPEPSWLDTSRSPSLVSSISERSTKCHDQVHVEAPLWRTFFAGRSRSVPHLSAISSPPLIMRTGSADHGEKSSLIGMNPSTREQSKRTTRFYLRGTWRNNRESTTLNGSSVSLDQATSQETKDMSSSRSSSLFRKSNRPFSRAFRASKRSNIPESPGRPIVSEPYDFRHLTGSTPNESDSFTSVPFSRDAMFTREAAIPSPPVSPGSTPAAVHADGVAGPWTVSEDPRALSHSTSFSRRSRQSSMLVIPPPRTSSRTAFTRINDQVPLDPSPPPTLYNYEMAEPSNQSCGSLNLDLSSQVASTASLDEGSWQFEILQMPHAITTPDDTAWPLKPLRRVGSGMELADVPEEDEGYFSPRLYTRSPMENPSPLLLQQTELPPDSRAASMAPTSRTSLSSLDSVTQPEHASPSQSQTLQPSESQSCLSVLTIPHGSSKVSRRLSVEVRDLSACWEDDIDYCYEHAVEADCAYDWGWNVKSGRQSKDIHVANVISRETGHGFNSVTCSSVDLDSVESETTGATASIQVETHFSQVSSLSSGYRPSLLVSTALDLPGLDVSSAVTSANEFELITPSQSHDQSLSDVHLRTPSSRNPFKESGLFVVNHSLFLPKEDDGQTAQELTEQKEPQGRSCTEQHISTPDREPYAESEVQPSPPRSQPGRSFSQRCLRRARDVSPVVEHRQRISTRKSNPAFHKASVARSTTNVTYLHTDGSDKASPDSLPCAGRLAHQRSPTKTSSRKGGLDDEQLKSSRERSQSIGTAKLTATARRKPESKVVRRNRSLSSASSLHTSSPTRVSYVLFPTS